MNTKKQIQEKLNYLYPERAKVELTGFRVDPDFKNVYRFINKEIQNLQLMLFRNEYKQFCDHHHESIDDSIKATTKKRDSNAV